MAKDLGATTSSEARRVRARGVDLGSSRRADGPPSRLDLDVPDDRFVASTLVLQSSHPGSALVVVTSDLNLQTKLSAVGLPHLEPDR
jgi:hypothetical protein